MFIEILYREREIELKTWSIKDDRDGKVKPLVTAFEFREYQRSIVMDD